MRTHLIVDCTLEEVGVAASLEAMLGGAPAQVVHAPTGSLAIDAREHASLIVSGSPASAYEDRPWLEPLFGLLRAATVADVPVLGVCFGHQAIAQALYGPGAVRRAWRSEIGWTEIECRDTSALFAGLPRRFPCFVSHFDEVVSGLPGLEVLARSDRCPVHAFRVHGRRVFGVQFHPELAPENCAELVRTKLAAHGYLGSDPLPVLARAMDARPLGRDIFARFLAVAGRRPLPWAPWRRATG